MQPLEALRDLLRWAGYTVYDIGNDEHLDHQPPEDHTPYSATGWPSAARFGVLYAIDVMPPAPNSGLPSLQVLGAKLRADRIAGLIPWLKYMNWGPSNDRTAVKDSWTSGKLVRSASSDTGHIHISGATGFEDDARWDSYTPFPGETVELNTPVGWSVQYTTEDTDNNLWLGGTVGQQLQYMRETTYFTLRATKRLEREAAGLRQIVQSLADVIQAGGGNVDTAALLAHLDERLDQVEREQRDAVADLGEGGAAQVRADVDGQGD